MFGCASNLHHHFHVEGCATSFDYRRLLTRLKAHPGERHTSTCCTRACATESDPLVCACLVSLPVDVAVCPSFVLSRRRSTGWIVLFVPDGRNLVQKGIYCQPSPVFENLYDLPIQASSGRYVTTTVFVRPHGACKPCAWSAL